MTVDVSPLTPFLDRFARVAAGSDGRLAMAEKPLCHMADLRIDPIHAVSLRSVLGAALPPTPNTVVQSGPAQLVWLGPDQWLVRSERPIDGLDAQIRAAATAPVSVVDVSASRTTISLAGGAARELLAHGCGLDLDAAQFPTGSCAQTRLALADVVLIAAPDQPADFATDPEFLILVLASFARYLAEWLLDAATEYLGG